MVTVVHEGMCEFNWVSLVQYQEKTHRVVHCFNLSKYAGEHRGEIVDEILDGHEFLLDIK